MVSCKKNGIEKEWERKIYAYCILNPNYGMVKCLVDSNYSIEKEVKSMGITDATVFIVNEENKDTLRLVGGYYTPYYHFYVGYNWNRQRREPFVKPLNTYSLWVIFQKDTLTKTTKIPDTFSFIFPKDEDTLLYDTFNYIYWHKSKGAYVYVLFVFKLPKDTIADYFPLFTQDTFLEIREIKEGLFDTTGFYELKVYAWDYNRYQWAIKRSELDTLYHGYGHFSSQTDDRIAIFVKRD
ncbi:MAG: hypothetical protein ABIK59_06075 [candidate division WOR-3 bacterium]|uniref:Uncharacterized protein n=1 Tax=candidate division WOR-3 bacterium TaxID=2052148 RepID=A0A7V4CGZ7_UNCW3